MSPKRAMLSLIRTCPFLDITIVATPEKVLLPTVSVKPVSLPHDSSPIVGTSKLLTVPMLRPLHSVLAPAKVSVMLS